MISAESLYRSSPSQRHFYDNKDESFSFRDKFSFCRLYYIRFKICDLQVVYHTFIAPQTMKSLQSRGEMSAIPIQMKIKVDASEGGKGKRNGLDELATVVFMHRLQFHNFNGDLFFE